MEALLQEIEKLEEETKDKPFIEEPKADVPLAEPEITEEPKEEAATEALVDSEPKESEEDRAKKAQEAYRERQRAKKEESERKAAEAADAAKAEAERKELLAKYGREELSEQDEVKKKLAIVDEIIRKEKINTWISNAETELQSLESEFKVAFTDYDDAVQTALDITIDRMVVSGMTKRQAEESMRLEKLKIADAAAAKGLDPVEAVYKEAKAINAWFESYAQKLGYQKTAPTKEKSLTQKAALREASKPSAVGGGKSASAAKYSFDEMDNIDDINSVPIGQMLRNNY